MSVSKYLSWKKFLESINYQVVSSEQESVSSNEITFKCLNNHIHSYALTSNKSRRKYLMEKEKSADEVFCIKCKNQQKIDTEIEKVTEKINSLKNPDQGAPAYQPTPEKLNDTNTLLEEKELKLVSFISPSKIMCICKCGTNFVSKLSDIKRGRYCLFCAKDRAKETNLKEKGVTNVFQTEEVKEKSRQTNLKKRGVEYPQQNKECVEKRKKTCKENHGMECCFNRKDVEKKVKEIKQSKEYLEQVEKLRLGEKNRFYHLNYREYFHKINFAKRKCYKSKTKEFITQGYENNVLDMLINKDNIDDKYIFNGKDIPSFTYIDENGKTRNYFPDILLDDGKEKVMIEVKSIFTYNMASRQNMKKFREIVKNGYKMKCYIFSSKCKLFDIWTFRLENDKLKLKTNRKNFKFGENYQIEDDGEKIDTDEIQLKEELEYECFKKQLEELEELEAEESIKEIKETQEMKSINEEVKEKISKQMEKEPNKDKFNYEDPEFSSLNEEERNKKLLIKKNRKSNASFVSMGKMFESYGFQILSNREEYYKRISNRVYFKCSKCDKIHDFSMDTLSRKLASYNKKTGEVLFKCLDCEFEEFKKQLKEKNGHILLEKQGDDCRYICGNCHLEKNSRYKDVSKSKGKCMNCYRKH